VGEEASQVADKTFTVRKQMARKLFIRTFGCQMNEYDSDKMADVLAASEEIVKTDTPDDADIILFNTCSVREKAQERVFTTSAGSAC
jgi:tRNA A37 methylthiotransferase MiaB